MDKDKYNTDSVPVAELKRFLDLLFSDYCQYEPARKLRATMLEELMLEKEQMQADGVTEKEAVARILTRLSDEEALRENSLLVYAGRFRRDASRSLFLWVLTALVFSVPLLVLGRLVVPLLLAVLSLLLAVAIWHYSDENEPADVAFFAYEHTAALSRHLSVAWLVLTVLWLIGALVVAPSGGWPQGESLLEQTRWLSRCYPPLLFTVFPLWAAGRERLLLANEVGAAPSVEAASSPHEAEQTRPALRLSARLSAAASAAVSTVGTWLAAHKPAKRAVKPAVTENIAAPTEPELPAEPAPTEPETAAEPALTEPEIAAEPALTEPETAAEPAPTEPEAAAEPAPTEPEAAAEPALTEPETAAEATLTEPKPDFQCPPSSELTIEELRRLIDSFTPPELADLTAELKHEQRDRPADQ